MCEHGARVLGRSEHAAPALLRCEHGAPLHPIGEHGVPTERHTWGLYEYGVQDLQGKARNPYQHNGISVSTERIPVEMKYMLGLARSTLHD